MKTYPALCAQCGRGCGLMHFIKRARPGATSMPRKEKDLELGTICSPTCLDLYRAEQAVRA